MYFYTENSYLKWKYQMHNPLIQKFYTLHLIPMIFIKPDTKSRLSSLCIVLPNKRSSAICESFIVQFDVKYKKTLHFCYSTHKIHYCEMHIHDKSLISCI